MNFKEQIETSSQMDQSFLLENFTKESLFKNYEEQLNINHELNFKNGELREEIERLKLQIKKILIK
jgi:hypothetical protein